MKKFNLAKVISLVFVCVMLLGALTLSVFATEDEKVEIVAQNMYYGDTYQIMYAINAPEGATVKATDSKGNEINVVPFAERPTDTVKGVECKIYILEKGVAAQAIDEVITVTVEYGNKKAVKNYSVLQYIYERSQAVEGAELEMLEALLAYAVKADVFFNGTTESFDKYQYVAATGVTANGVAIKGMYAPGSTPFANLDAIEYDAEKYELAVTVNGAASTLDALKALVVADEAINVVVEIVEKTHVHNYTPKVTDPTCTADGYTTFTCEECGDSYDEAGETATGHNYVGGACDACGTLDPDYYFEVTIDEIFASVLGAKVTFTGTVTSISDAWNEEYENISVYVTDESGSILCYRMKKQVVKGDIITVKGEIGEYGGAIQIINATAEIIDHDESYDEVEIPEVNIEEALELPEGTDVIVTGTVIRIDGAWNSSYGNMNVTIKDETGKELYVYRLATQVNVKDIITVTGQMGSYNGSKQVAAGATAEIIGTHECTDLTEATCNDPAACKFCGEIKGEALGHDYDVDGNCTRCDAQKPGDGATTTTRVDLETLNKNQSYVTSTTTSGWKAANAAVLTGGTTDSNPVFKFIGADDTTKAVCLNGKTTAAGKLTSSTLSGGISKLTFDYGLPFSDTKIGLEINIIQNGEVVATKTISNNSASKFTKYTCEWVLDNVVEGDFIIEIKNTSPSGSTSNKDRTAIFNIEWTSAPAK